ncbi:MAG: holo-ACP synthase [Eubacteriales bacterium]|nr:holo-ACP synthase [Eubacteriales bacterium]
MVVGIGVDLVELSEIERLINLRHGAFMTHTFSASEIEEASRAHNHVQYFAMHFAAKEAAFKAIASNIRENTFDFRLIETLNATDGQPSIHVCGELQTLLQEADIRQLSVSLSADGDYAIAMVIAESIG